MIEKKRGRWKKIMKFLALVHLIGFLVLQLSGFQNIFSPTQTYQRYIQAYDAQSVLSVSAEQNNTLMVLTKEESSSSTTTTNKCWRHCPQRMNKIYFSNGESGLSDRSVVLQMLGNMAGYLCAIVEMPPPYLLLNTIHNRGRSLDKRVEWKDFFNFTFQEDGTQIIHEAKDNPNFPPGFQNWRKPGLYDRKKYPGWELIVTKEKGRSSIVNAYRKAQELSWKQEINSTDDNKGFFIWEIHRSIFKSRLVKVAPLPKPNNKLLQTLQDSYHGSMRPVMKSWKRKLKNQTTDACNYINRVQPDRMLNLIRELQDRVRSLAQPSSPSTTTTTTVVGFFHVRRNDAIKACDTSIPNLRRFFQCSLNGTETTGKHITFLLGSDETNNAYRKDVIDMAKDYPHVSILDADKIVMDFMRDMIEANKMPKWLMNNFYQFELLKAIGLDRKSFVSIYLVQRRHTECPRCFQLTQEFPKVWV